MKKFLKELNKAVAGAIFTCLVIVFQIVNFALGSRESVPSWYFVTLLGFSMIACIAVYAFFKSKYGLTAANRPSVRKIINNSGITILVADQVEYLTQDSVVSVYINKDGFEELIGLGYIETINAKGFFQIRILDETPGRFEMISPERLVIRPSVPRSFANIDL